MQFNFATRYPGMYSSSASHHNFNNSSGQKPFNLIPMHNYPPVNGMVNPFVTDPNQSSSSNQMQQEKLFSFLDPRTAFYPHTIIVQQPMIQQAVFFQGHNGYEMKPQPEEKCGASDINERLSLSKQQQPTLKTHY